MRRLGAWPSCGVRIGTAFGAVRAFACGRCFRSLCVPQRCRLFAFRNTAVFLRSATPWSLAFRNTLVFLRSATLAQSVPGRLNVAGVGSILTVSVRCLGCWRRRLAARQMCAIPIDPAGQATGLRWSPNRTAQRRAVPVTLHSVTEPSTLQKSPCALDVCASTGSDSPPADAGSGVAGAGQSRPSYAATRLAVSGGVWQF